MDMDVVAKKPDLVYRTAGDEDLLLDAYLPAKATSSDQLPGVIFIHGGPVPPERSNLKETEQYQTWGGWVAASGFVGFTFNHRYSNLDMLPESIADIQAAIAYVRENAETFRLDPTRLCLWVCSGGGPHISFVLRDQPDYVRCLVIYYAVMDLQPMVDYYQAALDKEIITQNKPILHLQGKPIRFPIFVARAGQDLPALNESLDGFVAKALQANVDIEVMNHAQGEHGFDFVDDGARSKQIIARTLAFMQENT